MLGLNSFFTNEKYSKSKKIALESDQESLFWIIEHKLRHTKQTIEKNVQK